ncbi:hypothetical protein [Aphanizomenon flos-aquae]|uniref:hypothetical protein n=1 Tax=Aphanizomenon flos-aquae TaxID=1176 RepID=UPI00048236A1|nr:hypothetical protein [Aphanizomenon flos-aquae]
MINLESTISMTTKSETLLQADRQEYNNDWILGLIPILILLGFVIIPVAAHINIYKKEQIIKSELLTTAQVRWVEIAVAII